MSESNETKFLQVPDTEIQEMMNHKETFNCLKLKKRQGKLLKNCFNHVICRISR